MSTAFVVGATGGVGAELVRILGETQHFQKVVILARRNVDNAQGEKFDQQTIDFDKLEEHAASFKGVDVGFCALGTTRAKAGSAEGWYKVDHDYVVNTAKLAKENGVKQFVLVSASIASESSPFLYTKTKGQVEREVGEIGFEKLVIMRPGLIEVKRERQEVRYGEVLAKIILTPFKLFSDNLASTATQVAQAMIAAAKSPENGTMIWNNAKIVKEAKGFE